MKRFGHLRFATILLLAAIGMGKLRATDGDIFTVDNISYTIISELDKTVKTTEGSRLKVGNPSAIDANLPTTVLYKNTLYSLVEIGDYSFYNNSNIKSIRILNGIVKIGKCAFSGCTGLTGDLIIPNTVTTICEEAFRGCTGFSGSLTIGNSVTSIEKNAFYGCSGFTGSLTIGNSVTSIDRGAFSGCSGFNGVYISNLEAWCKFDFNPMIDNPLYYAENLYLNGQSINNLVIPDGVTEIGRFTFANARNITGSLTIPESVTSIGGGAFRWCSNLTGDLIIPNSVTSIEDFAFEGCSGFSSLTLGSSLESLGSQKSGGVFSDCLGLMQVTSLAKVPPTCWLANFNDRYTIPLYVPAKSVSAYKQAFEWKKFNPILPIVEEVSVSLDKETMNLYVGGSEMLTATHELEDVNVELTWSSDKQDVATVVAGKVTAIAPGTANITVTAGNATATCKVTVSALTGTVEVEDDDIIYVVEASKKSAYVKGPKSKDLVKENVLIRDYVTEGGIDFPVTSIADNAFKDCTGLSGTLTIGNNVISIGNYAFQYCSGFTGALTIPESVTSISTTAFYDCSGFTGNLIIPNSVTKLGQWAFSGCKGFNSLTLGSSLETLGNEGRGNVFYDCLGLKEVTSLSEIPPRTWNSNFSNYEIPLYVPAASVEEYKNAYDWSQFNPILPLEAKNLNVSLDKETMNLYVGGSETLAVTLKPADIDVELIWSSDKPEVATVVDGKVTGVAPGTANITVTAGIATATCVVTVSALTGTVEVEDDDIIYVVEASKKTAYVKGPKPRNLVKENVIIKEYVSAGGLDFPVTSIAISAFQRCSGLSGSLTIGNNVTSIGNYAFLECSGFTGALVIPNSVTSIGEYAFKECSGFTGDLVIPNSVTEIGNRAFERCSGFTGSLTIGNSVTSIGEWAFFNCSGFTGSLTIGNSVTSIGSHSFNLCSGFTGSLIIPESVISIGQSAFLRCSGFNGSLTIGNSVTSIGTTAFDGCSGFTGDLVIPNSVTSIGPMAFEDCSGFTGDLVIPNSVTEIGNRAFYGCKGFRSLTLGCSLKTLGNENNGSVFSYCSSLKEVTSLAKLPPTTKEANFSNYNIPLYVPAASVDAYKSAFDWKNFNPILPIPKAAESVSLSAVSLENTSNKKDLKTTESVEFTLSFEPADATFASIEWSADVVDTFDFVTPQDGDGTQVTATVRADAPKGPVTVTARLAQNAKDAQDLTATYTVNISDLMLGDANDSGNVNVADVLTVRNEILAQNSSEPSINETFCFINADVYVDKKIDVVDQTAITNLAMGLEAFPKTNAPAKVAAQENVLIADDFLAENDIRIGFDIPNASDYVIIQADVHLPEGMTFTAVDKGDKASAHELSYSVSDENVVRVMLYSLGNVPFRGNGENLFSIKADAMSVTDDITVDNIVASTASVQRFELGFEGGHRIMADTVEEIDMTVEGPFNIYTPQGLKVKANAEASDFYKLAPGIYIVVTADGKSFKIAR